MRGDRGCGIYNVKIINLINTLRQVKIQLVIVQYKFLKVKR